MSPQGQPETRPIEQACYWLATRRRPADPPLSGRREADVAIVGAGFTGLWTAIALKSLDPGLGVVVLEQGTAAYGASGRNAGMMGESIDHSHALAVAHFGREEAQRLAVLGVANTGDLMRFLSERGIDCDLERTGQLYVALSEGQVDELRQAAEVAWSLGMSQYRLLSAAETRAEIDCERYQGALFNPHCASVNPVKLVEGLKREAAKSGVIFCEQTRVTGIDTSGAAVRVRAAGGEVLARKVVLATSAYTHQLLPRLRHRFIPLYDYILVSEPIPPERLARIGWRHRQSVTDTRAFFKYYRLTADNRILWGTSEARYYSGNRVDTSCDHSERHYAELRDSFGRHFPALGKVEFPYAWGGAICSTTRFTPFFGAARGGRVLYGLGYTGHGVASTRLAGQILAHMTLGRPSPLLDLSLVRKKPFPYPPEPLRTLAVSLVTRALRRVDAGGRPGLLLRCLDALGIGLSS
ncbi:MAG TPA: FAD-binding oxidoreductase [Candidatus Polarisedimenticolia bacterium]|nr:FAD-binding oxidoreductase [Candidatus Polarisedimenticolia bacterium]